MRMTRLALIWLAVVTAAEAQSPGPSRASARAKDDCAETHAEALARWRADVEVGPLLGDSPCHTIHTYFNTSPESPDGKWVLLYRSTAADAHRGDICIVERDTSRVKVLARDVVAEDAHRVACQQWVAGGQQVVFHDLRDEQWVVISVDVRSGAERVLARGRQIGWGQPDGDTRHGIPIPEESSTWGARVRCSSMVRRVPSRSMPSYRRFRAGIPRFARRGGCS